MESLNLDYGSTAEEAIHTTIKHVTAKYPPTDEMRTDLTSSNQKTRMIASEFFVKALGQFIGEATYAVYYPQPLVIEKVMRIYGSEGSLQDITRMLSFFYKGEQMSDPQVASLFGLIVDSEFCLFPKQTVRCLLSIPQDDQFALEDQGEYKLNNPSSTSAKAQQQECLSYEKQLAIATTSAFTGGFLAGVSTFCASKAAKLKETKPFVAVSAAVGAVSGGVIFLLTWAGLKHCENNKQKKIEMPSTKLKRVDERNYLEIPMREFGLPATENDLYKYNETVGYFEKLKSVVDGSHPGLLRLFPKEDQRNLFIILTRSFLEAQYEMLIKYPGVLEEKYKLAHPYPEVFKTGIRLQY